MENKYTKTNANTEGEKLRRIFIETPLAVQYANCVIKAASEVSEERCKEEVGRDVHSYLRVDFVCEAVITMFKDPDSPVDKDKFLRGVVAFMLAHQMQQDIEKQTGESNKKEESNG